MSIKRKLKRDIENKLLKHRRSEILKELKMSKSELARLAPRITGEGLSYGDVEFRNSRGYVDSKNKRIGFHKPSLKSQFSLLFDMLKQKYEDDEMLSKIKEELDEKAQEEKTNANER